MKSEFSDFAQKLWHTRIKNGWLVILTLAIVIDYRQQPSNHHFKNLLPYVIKMIMTWTIDKMARWSEQHADKANWRGRKSEKVFVPILHCKHLTQVTIFKKPLSFYISQLKFKKKSNNAQNYVNQRHRWKWKKKHTNSWLKVESWNSKLVQKSTTVHNTCKVSVHSGIYFYFFSQTENERQEHKNSKWEQDNK